MNHLESSQHSISMNHFIANSVEIKDPNAEILEQHDDDEDDHDGDYGGNAAMTGYRVTLEGTHFEALKLT